MEHGFRWFAKTRTVQRQVGGVVHQIALQSSSYNRAGGPISISTYVAVQDPAMRRWRQAHPQLIAAPVDHDFVCGHLLGYASGRANGYLYGDARDGDIDLAEPAEREWRLERFVAMLQVGVLPWFAGTSDPESIVNSRAGDYTNNPVALLEWLTYQGDPISSTATPSGTEHAIPAPNEGGRTAPQQHTRPRPGVACD